MEACVMSENWMLLQQALSQVATLVLKRISVQHVTILESILFC